MACCFSCAVENTNIRVIKLLLEIGADLNAADVKGYPPLLIAILDVSLVAEINRKSAKKTIKFLLEYSDVNVISSDGHVLTVSLPDAFLPSLVWKLILKHLAKLQMLNIPLHPAILKTISESLEYSNFFQKCSNELITAKSTKLQNTWVSFFNLLVDSRKKLKNYAGNRDLIKDFNKSECLKKFSIYGASMKKNVNKGVRRRKLFDKSCVLLSECLPIFNSFHLIIRGVVECITSKKDLSKLCEN